MKKIICIFTVFICAVFITACGTVSNPMVSIDVNDMINVKHTAFSSPDEENTLEVDVNRDNNSSDEYYNYYYVFYWKDGNGMTDAVASCKTKYIDFDFDIDWNEDNVLIEFQSSEDKNEKFTIDYPDKTPVTQTMQIEINNELKPEIKAVEITGDCWGKIENKVNAKDVYKIQAYVSETVGLVHR